MIDRDDVRYFLALARGGSVRAAAEPLPARVPGAPLHMHGTLWLLTQGEARKTKRVRLFTEFISRRLAAYATGLAGRFPPGTSRRGRDVPNQDW
jgi:DNA-binding transcriptional LysR family regulator